MYSDFKTIASYYDELYVKDEEYAPEATKVKELLSKHGTCPAVGSADSGLRNRWPYPLFHRCVSGERTGPERGYAGYSRKEISQPPLSPRQFD